MHAQSQVQGRLPRLSNLRLSWAPRSPEPPLPHQELELIGRLQEAIASTSGKFQGCWLHVLELNANIPENSPMGS